MNKEQILKKAKKSYSAQKTRCYNKTSTQYKWYGAKGICVEYTQSDFINWYLNAFKKFKGNRPTVGRIDHSKNYSLDNIEMISQSDNSKERISRSGIPDGKFTIIAINQKTGETRIFESAYDVSDKLGCSVSTVHRQARGYSKNPITKWKFKYEDFH